MPTWGRGGAGNIVSQTQIEESEKRIAEDLEAQKPLSSSAAPPATTSNPPPDYAHSGRGGAGNWYEPKTLEQSGHFTQPTDSTAAPSSTSKLQISTPYHPPNTELPVARAGRGGAGNFVWKSGEDDGKREEEREKEEGVRERVVRDVEIGLMRPEKVVLGKGGKGDSGGEGEQHVWS